MIPTRCPVCEARAADILVTKNGYTVGACTNCGLIRTLARQDTYEQLYTDGESYHTAHQLGEGHVPYAQRFDHDFAVAGKRYTKLATWFRSLDVGCSNGAFVHHMQQAGWDAEGLEINVTMAAWAQQRTGCVIHTSWDQVEGPYDLVTYHDVFEHLVDPADELRRLRTRVLRTGGMLILDVPDANDPRFKELGAEWHHMRPEQHLHFWTVKDLVPFLEDRRFDVVHIDFPIQGKLVIYARSLG